MLHSLHAPHSVPSATFPTNIPSTPLPRVGTCDACDMFAAPACSLPVHVAPSLQMPALLFARQVVCLVILICLPVRVSVSGWWAE